MNPYYRQTESKPDWEEIEAAGYIINYDGNIIGKTGVVLKGHVNNRGYRQYIIRVNGKSYTYKCSRLVAMKYLNAQPKHIIDHIDRNTLNDCADNLRVSDFVLNKANSCGHDGSSSIYKGVSVVSDNSFRVNINRGHFGNFEDEIEAAQVANEVYKILYKEHAYLNDVPELPYKYEWKMHLKRLVYGVVKRKRGYFKAKISIDKKIHIKSFKKLYDACEWYNHMVSVYNLDRRINDLEMISKFENEIIEKMWG